MLSFHFKMMMGVGQLMRTTVALDGMKILTLVKFLDLL